MTTKKLTGILSLFLCIICLVSCNDNDDNFSPITLNMKILKLSSTTRAVLHTDSVQQRNDTTLHQGWRRNLQSDQ